MARVLIALGIAMAMLLPLSAAYAASPTTTTLASSQNPSAWGQSVTFTATVTSTGGSPTGKVAFQKGGATVKTSTLAGGIATFVSTTLAVGTDSIVAVYNGSAAFSTSTSTAVAQVVTKAPTTTALTSSTNPSAFGKSMTLSATVTAAFRGTPAGKITFKNGGAVLGTATLAGGSASLVTSSLGAGTDSLAAVYGGGATFTGSTSAPLTQVISAASTSTALASSPNPSTYGQSVTITATVTPQFGGTPTGSVSFANGATALGNSALVNGIASLSTSALPPGTLSISSSYASNSANFAGSTAALTQTVATGYSVVASVLQPNSVPSGGSATSTVTVTPASGYSGSVNLSCSINTGVSNAPSCGLSPAMVTLSGGAATSTLTVDTSSNTPSGSYSVSVSGSDADNLAPGNGPQALTFISGAVIQHIVIIFQENRTPDTLFHDPVLIARGADLASSAVNSQGQTIQLSPIDLGTTGTMPQNYGLGHGHNNFLQMYHGGKMDGTNGTCTGSCPADAQYKYVIASDVQPYFDLAEQYTFGDRMFQTNEGPSFPAHQFIISGTSAPTAESPLFASENPPLTQQVACTAPASALVKMIDATGSEKNSPAEFPCFEHQTLIDLLDDAGVTWRYYTPLPGSIFTGPNAIRHLCQPLTIGDTPTCTSSDWTNNVIVPQSIVLTDIANGELAQVSWVIPDGKASDHPSYNDGSGPSWVASVVNAIGNSPYWANTAIFITWDDWGGWYDHVPPPIVGDGVSWGSGYVYGFRVPLIVVSPYAKAAYISHVQHDFGSILNFVENTFALPSLGYADGYADDLSDCFDFAQTPIPFQTIAAPMHAAFFIDDKREAVAPDDD